MSMCKVVSCVVEKEYLPVVKSLISIVLIQEKIQINERNRGSRSTNGNLVLMKMAVQTSRTDMD